MMMMMTMIMMMMMMMMMTSGLTSGCTTGLTYLHLSILVVGIFQFWLLDDGWRVYGLPQAHQAPSLRVSVEGLGVGLLRIGIIV